MNLSMNYLLYSYHNEYIMIFSKITLFVRKYILFNLSIDVFCAYLKPLPAQNFLVLRFLMKFSVYQFYEISEIPALRNLPVLGKRVSGTCFIFYIRCQNYIKVTFFIIYNRDNLRAVGSFLYVFEVIMRNSSFPIKQFSWIHNAEV